MGQSVIDPYPWFLHKHIEFDVDGRPARMQVNVSEWTERWRPLLEYLSRKHIEHYKRLVIGIGGPPGSGKAYFAEQINWIMGKGIVPGCYAMTLPMEGFFFPHQYLRHNYRKTTQGKIPLEDVKGAPDTYDTVNLKEHLSRLRADEEDDLYWPGFSPEYNDILPRHYRVHQTINVVIVQGDFALLDRGPFSGVPSAFDVKIFIDSPAAAIISHLMQRRMRNGETESQAKESLKVIDLPNARIAEATRGQADLVIERNTNNELVSLKWKNPADVPDIDTPAITHQKREEKDEPGVF